MPKLTVDGIEVEVPAGATVLQACEAAGKEVPRFCYHERLSIAGNCRMCLVEVKPGPPKPQASCALPAADKQEIFTNSAMVKKAREGVMEFLLINHPLDCPICDQGGECDLQDQSIAYGKGHSRFDENKRAVTEKYMGPIVRTQMTRCIQCTRCVRFAEEVAGVEEIGAIYRGENMQITTYLEKAATSELSGNVVDLCPVGALTSKPYAFEARPWELKKTPGIDVMDAIGTNVRLDSRGRQVLRALPRVNEDVNEEWASDKTRHAVDGLVRNRIDKPYIRIDGKLRAATWDEAFQAIARAAEGLAGHQVAGLAGDLAEVESVYALKQLLGAFGSDLHEARVDGALYDVSNPASYRFNPTIAGVETAKAILLVGANPRWEAPLVNTRIRKAIKKGATVYAVGPEVDLTYPVQWLGADISALNELPESLAGEGVIVIAGMGACAIEGGYGAARQVASALGAGFGLLHTAAGRVGALDLGFTTEGGLGAVAAAAPGLLFALGVDETDLAAIGAGFTVYIGTHGDRGAHAADVILPGATYVEKPGTWVNMEGRVQRTERAVFPVGDAREDWTILRALSGVLGKTLPFDNLGELRATIYADYPALAEEGIHLAGALDPAPKGGDVSGAIVYPITDFYLTNPIARSSPTMQRCSAELLHGQTFAEAAE
ncbi:NADH-quinone oxidoreductase subunit NuoG [Sphingomonas abietis]|uniref:NADH-quinone oxidoreductase n=1 Tax=Sphingomonas abietis TaxID=3012344 RepID=A0ABY7NW31_9SPHN|nr:NADH-quinone oxidoreductase subunit NuoG [Sphingomonas abietis]WBO23646.1 NADH-quinone oxidoreductase subunit NuoG [Sphingomonas abietis]